MITSRYKILKAQKKFLHLPKDVKIDIAIYQGGYGSGKTFIGSYLSVELCLLYEGIKGIVGALDYSLLEKTTIDSIRGHLNHIGLKEEIHYTFSKRGTRLTFINGSQIDFIHLKDYESFKSMECAFFEIEECSQVDWETIKHTFGRLRQPKRPEWGDNFVYRWFGHTNTGGRRGWIYKNFIKNPIENSRIIKAPTTQNVFLSPVYVKQLMDLMTPEEVAQFIHGNDINFDATLMYPYFSEENMIESYTGKDKYYLCCDFNVNPMCWYIGYYDDNNFYIVDELIGNNVTTEKMCDLYVPYIVETYGKDIILTGDATGQNRKTNGDRDYSIIDDAFGKHGITTDWLLLKKNPDKAERLALFGGVVCNYENKRRLYVTKKCNKLLYNFYNLERNNTNQHFKEPTDKMIAKNKDLLYLGHPIDAVSYFVYNILM